MKINVGKDVTEYRTDSGDLIFVIGNEETLDRSDVQQRVNDIERSMELTRQAIARDKAQCDVDYAKIELLNLQIELKRERAIRLRSEYQGMCELRDSLSN
jgi:hypothetical protein